MGFAWLTRSCPLARIRSWIACAAASPSTLPMICSICMMWNDAWAADCVMRPPPSAIAVPMRRVFMEGNS
jgi:hypothetical protein